MMILYAPVDAFLPLLAQGWKFCGHVAAPMNGHHGCYSVLLWREDAP
jgi:hypothetical protein